jgi:hypothetical protein
MALSPRKFYVSPLPLHDPRPVRAEFNLINELYENCTKYACEKGADDYGQIELGGFPTILVDSNLRRYLSKTDFSPELACRALMKDSLDSTLNFHPYKVAWCDMRKEMLEQNFDDVEEWREIEEYAKNFQFNIMHEEKKGQRKQMRIPYYILNPYRAIASNLGITQSNLIQLGIMEALQYQNGIMDVERLQENVSRFFRHLRRRVRHLAFMFYELEIDFTKGMKTAVDAALEISKKERA